VEILGSAAYLNAEYLDLSILVLTLMTMKKKRINKLQRVRLRPATRRKEMSRYSQSFFLYVTDSLDKLKTIILQLTITFMLIAAATRLVTLSFKPITENIQISPNKILPVLAVFGAVIFLLAGLIFIFILLLRNKNITAARLEYKVTQAFERALDQSAINPNERKTVHDELTS
jgi:hypothetical protein